MKILIIGKNGQVGWELQRTHAALGEIVAVDCDQVDLVDPDSIRRIIREVKPSLIVNAAAYTAVDKAESEPEAAMKINGVAPGIMAEEAKRIGAAVIHYSTDYVFDGSKDAPYLETDSPCPINSYGRSKLAGEQALAAVDNPYLVLRTSWVYGVRGANFLLTIRRLSRERESLRIIDDQIGAPTWSRMIAEATALIVARRGVSGIGEASGIYHLTSAGAVSWHGFASRIVDFMSEIDPAHCCEIVPIATSEYPLPAARPKNSRLDNRKLEDAFGISIPDWSICLGQCMQDLYSTAGK